MASPDKRQTTNNPNYPTKFQDNYSGFSYVPQSDSMNPFNREEAYIGFNDNIKLMQDVNKNHIDSPSKGVPKSLKHGFPKILCLKKTAGSDLRHSLITLNVNSLENLNANNTNASKQSLVTSTTTEKSNTNRNSVHQNVDEALNSLLWQPYEYQNQNINEYGGFMGGGNRNCDYESSHYSTCSYTPSTSPISIDLDEPSVTSPSFNGTKNNVPSSSSSFLECTTATVVPPPSPFERRDLHSDVINLNRQEVANQSEQVSNDPRDPFLQHTNAGAFVSLPSVVASSQLDTVRYDPRSVVQSSLLEVSATKCSFLGECSGRRTRSMQSNRTGVEQPGGGTTSLSFSVSENGLKSIQADASLNAANIVGLPSSHARFTSVPPGFQTTPTSRPQPSQYGQHFRNVSEPSQQILRPNYNGQVPPPLHHPMEQQINHFRSSSVPKSMPLVNNNNSTVRVYPPQSIIGQRVPKSNVSVPVSSQNVSNVNVNFYRAVPVNVVSSVPTINCLNTLTNDQGNSVSNVQVLPLGNHHHHHQTSDNNKVVVHNVNPARTDNTTTRVGYQQPIVNRTTRPFNSVVSTTPTRTIVSVHNSAPPEVISMQAGRTITTTAQINTVPNVQRTRTFTNSEAQTDEILPAVAAAATPQREQRRRERRERRQHRRNNPRTTTSTTESGTQSTIESQTTENNNRLPDILNSHLPPPYSTLPNAQAGSMVPPPPQILPSMLLNPSGPVLQTVVPNGIPASAFVFPSPQQMAPLMQNGAPVPVAVPAPAPVSGFRFGFPANGFRRSRFSDDSPKGCCGFLTWKPGSLRWFIALIALVAVCCVLVGTALGAMRPAGRDHLTVSLLMIGVGLVLITVSGVAWRLTSHDSSTCRSMLGLGSTESVDVCARRFVPRLPPSYGRPHHPYAAMMYPEFQYRPPPPSYQASMQEYRLRLLLLDRGNSPQIQAGIQNAVSPPPTYRSHAGSLLRAPLSSRREVNQSEYSCPPSYRSQNSSNRPGTLTNGSILHSRDPSLTMSHDSNHDAQLVNVVNILGSADDDIALDNITLDSLKLEPEPGDINPLKMLLKGSQSDLEGSKDGNLVTIVQTSDQNSVIVTVSGCSAHDNNSTVQITEIPSEMEILAHL